jgi:hypothetical protein
MNNYEEFNSLNESTKEPKFKVDDAVVVNSNLLKAIGDYGWNDSMKRHVGEKYFINRIVFDDYRYRYYILPGTFVYDDCIDSTKPQIRWYKKGKLENDE